MSLDLNKLANKLDEALKKETTETLTKFLTDKRTMKNKQNKQQTNLNTSNAPMVISQTASTNTAQGYWVKHLKIKGGNKV